MIEEGPDYDPAGWWARAFPEPEKRAVSLEEVDGQLRLVDSRLERLERRLEHYHHRMEDSLEHDRRFQLKATWGIVNASVGIGAYIGLTYVANHWLHRTGFLLGAAVAFLGLVAFALAFAWSDKGRKRDEKNLSQLPRWPDIT